MDVIGNIFHDIYRDILKFLNEDDIPRDTGESQDSRSGTSMIDNLIPYISVMTCLRRNV